MKTKNETSKNKNVKETFNTKLQTQ